MRDMENAEKFLELLRERGCRLTKNRKAILEVITASRRPLDYSEIQKELKQRGVFPNRATIYREIGFLLKQNVVRRLQLNDGKVRYETVSQDHHHHAVCVRCNEVEHLAVLEHGVVLAERAVFRKNKFKVLRHSLEFYGLCQRCR